MSIGVRRRGRRVALVVALAIFAPTVQAQESCFDLIQTAKGHYSEGNFNAVPSLLAGCLVRPTQEEEAVAAYRLLILSHVRRGDVAAAKRAIVRLLVRVPPYEPDVVLDPPVYRALVADVQRALGLQPADDARCDIELTAANAAYHGGAYDRVIAVLMECLGKPAIDDADTVPAYRLLALAHLKRSDIDAAREAVAAALRIDPDFRADPVQDLPEFVGLVEFVRSRGSR